MAAGAESVRRLRGFHLWTENSGQVCQEGRQISNPYLEELINPVFPRVTIMTTEEHTPLAAHKFCRVHVSVIQSF